MKDKNRSTFDPYAEEYDRIQRKNMAFLGNNVDVDVFAKYKVNFLQRFLSTTPHCILEFGCGTGRNLPFLRESFPAATIFGCDISEKSLAIAAQRDTKAELFVSATPQRIAEECGKVDMVLLSCVLHHIPAEEQVMWINALRHSLSERGVIFVFEHNPYNPVTRYLVNTCPYDEGVQLITVKECKKLFKSAELNVISTRYTLLSPWRHPWMLALERRLEGVPLGGQYCMWGSVGTE